MSLRLNDFYAFHRLYVCPLDDGTVKLPSSANQSICIINLTSVTSYQHLHFFINSWNHKRQTFLQFFTSPASSSCLALLAVYRETWPRGCSMPFTFSSPDYGPVPATAYVTQSQSKLQSYLILFANWNSYIACNKAFYLIADDKVFHWLRQCFVWCHDTQSGREILVKRPICFLIIFRTITSSLSPHAFATECLQCSVCMCVGVVNLFAHNDMEIIARYQVSYANTMWQWSLYRSLIRWDDERSAYEKRSRLEGGN